MDTQFWQEVYVAAIRAGYDPSTLKTRADRALAELEASAEAHMITQGVRLAVTVEDMKKGECFIYDGVKYQVLGVSLTKDALECRNLETRGTLDMACDLSVTRSKA